MNSLVLLLQTLVFLPEKGISHNYKLEFTPLLHADDFKINMKMKFISVLKPNVIGDDDGGNKNKYLICLAIFNKEK